MRRILITITAFLGVGAMCALLTGAATHFSGPLILETHDAGTSCSTATGAGSLCAAGDVEAEDDFDVGDDLTVGDDTVFTDDVDIGGTITLENDEQIKNSTDDMICLIGSGGTSDEDLCFDTDGTNVIALNSSTGVVELDLAAIGTTVTLANDEFIKNDDNGKITIGANAAEDLDFVLSGTNAVSLASSTGVVELDLAAVGTTLKLANDQTIVSDTDNEIQLGDGTEDFSFGFATANEVTVSTDTGVTRMDFGSMGVKTAAPMLILDEIRFCGQGPNATTATYIGPTILSDAAFAHEAASVAFASAHCDAKDNTTEATADLPLSTAWAYKAVAMVCMTTCGTDDTMTLQMRDDTADVTGLTCNITLSGSAAQCSVILEAPVTIASGSAIAVKAVNSDNDDCSAGDIECKVFITY